MNAFLVLDFARSSVRRYVILRSPQRIAFDGEFAISGQPDVAGVEVVRQTGSIQKPKSLTAGRERRRPGHRG